MTSNVSWATRAQEGVISFSGTCPLSLAPCSSIGIHQRIPELVTGPTKGCRTIMESVSDSLVRNMHMINIAMQ